MDNRTLAYGTLAHGILVSRSGQQAQSVRKFATGLLAALFCALGLLALEASPVQAQEITTFRVYPQLLRDVGTAAESVSAAGVDDSHPKQIIIDTDPGVDDVAALAWALSQSTYDVEILGIVATAGNASLENATRNALIVRQLAWSEDELAGSEDDIPVYAGERKPLVKQLSSTGLLIHGIDGLWSAGNAYGGDLPDAERQAWRFYCDTARSIPDDETGPTIVALGPLTNVGRAIRSCGRDMLNYAEIIVLGGAQFGGNTTPVAEFNFWQDPEAADLVLNSGMNITMIPLDTFSTLQFVTNGELPIADLVSLATSTNPLGPLLGCPLGFCPPIFPPDVSVEDLVPLSPLGIYLNTQLGFVDEASIPDLAAVMYAFNSELGTLTEEKPLVKVMLRPELVRGQTIIGFGQAKVTMIVDDRELSRLAEAAYEVPFTVNGVLVPLPPGLQLPSPDFLGGEIDAILAREPGNVNYVTAIDVPAMRELFFAALEAPLPVSAGAAAVDGVLDPAQTAEPPIPQLFVPTLGWND